MVWALFLMGLGMLAFCYVRVTGVVFLFLLLFAPGYGGGMVMRGAILREYFGRDSFGKMFGILMGFGSIGGMGVRLILRYKSGKMTVNEECPELLPAIA